jgi:hypothetical protein
MKRLFAFILFVIYSVTSIGATVQLHYCMGKLAGWSLVWTDTKSKECSKCGMGKKHNSAKDCCRDENRFLKIKDDQKANYVSLEILKLAVTEPVIADHSFSYFFPVINERLLQNNALRRSSEIDIYKRNCLFRI